MNIVFYYMCEPVSSLEQNSDFNFVKKMLTTTTEEPEELRPSGLCPETKQMLCRKLTCWEQGVLSQSKTTEGLQTSRGQE